MPIASGAAGRVDVGGDVSTTWTPDGLRGNTKPAYKNHNSYLQRYKELKQTKKHKSHILQVTQVSTEQRSQETDEAAKEDSPVKNGGSDGHALRKASGRDGSKMSKLCVLL